MRLIDADALAERIKRNDDMPWNLDRLSQVAFASIVNHAPTYNITEVYEQIAWERDVAIGQLESYGVSLGERADVAVVRHGRWVPANCYYKGRPGFSCSECDWIVYDDDFDYCPHCGAKMDGGNNGI